MNIDQWTPAARADLAAIDDYYISIDPDYALRLGRAAIDAAQFLATRPGAGSRVDGATRKWRVRRTPYILLYRVTPRGIEVLRVRHAAEDWRPE